MVGSYTRFVRACHAQVFPRERSLVDVQTPDVIDWLGACVSSEDKIVRRDGNNGLVHSI